MSESIEGLKKKIDGASDLRSVVRTMKALAASSLGQYEKSVLALDDYYHNVEMGLYTCLLNETPVQGKDFQENPGIDSDIVIFGSDQGLVGKFNEEIANYVKNWLLEFHGKYCLWVVGERIENQLIEAGLSPTGKFTVPNSVNSISYLIGKILGKTASKSLYIFYNKSHPHNVFETTMKRVLPLDSRWIANIKKHMWPTKNLPGILGDLKLAFEAHIREYIFVSLFRACAQSLAAENASRLAAMQRAEKNIDEILDEYQLLYHRIRQENIDEELFDVISGFEALKASHKIHKEIP